mmetsp:Transcript_559/g.1050  ORF Transcript_559/g.1050 Transcript_559/m.1050 type:complete len:82 (-) Transcript_559:200-445(-)
MASTGFKLEKDMPLKQLIAGLEPLMPVGSRNFSMLEADGTDSKGETKFKETSLASLQDEIHKEDENWDWDKSCYKPSKFSQ